MSDAQIVGTGRIGISNPFVEGTPETRLAAHKERVSEPRIAVVRSRFFEVPAEHVETRRVGRVTYVVDTRSNGRVYEYLDPVIEVFAHGDHQHRVQRGCRRRVHRRRRRDRLPAAQPRGNREPREARPVRV